MNDALHHKTLGQLSALVRNGAASSTEVTTAFLRRAESLDPRLSAFRLLDADRALEAARAADRDRTNDPGPLGGLPFAVKDLIDVAGLPTTAGSSLLAANIAAADAGVVQRLRTAGMILIGKTNTVQFAYGGVGVNHDHGTPRNPWTDEHYVPGGSSSGSGVAVAAGMVPMALGTDTGGSVRIPAALCGITGLKTTVGRVSRAGVYPLSHSLDSIGPMCRTVEDAALVYDVLHGPDPEDPTTRGLDRHDVLSSLEEGVRGTRLAFAESVFWDGVDSEVATAVRGAGDVFRSLGAHVESIDFPVAERARSLNPRGLVIAAEAYAVNRRWVDNHQEQLDPVVGTRLLAGREILAADYLDTVRAWGELRAEADEALRDLDGLLCPTTPAAACPVAQADADLDAYLSHNLRYLRNTNVGNVLGLCALSIPCGFTSAGLPIGLMIYGRAFSEDRLLRVGHAFQTATSWHRERPRLD